jgi:hypothetical protein
MPRGLRWYALIPLCLSLTACLQTALYPSVSEASLRRCRRYYEQASFDRSLSLLKAVERDSSASAAAHSRFALLRGLVHWRLGEATDARYWLALATGLDQRHPGSLRPEELAELHDARVHLADRALPGADAVQIIEDLPQAPPDITPEPALTPPPSSAAQ